MNTKRPTTYEEFMALPVGVGFGTREEIVGGRRVVRPVAPVIVAHFDGPNDIVSLTDNEAAWTIGRYADGTWFRRRL